jgi:hypothetical protein
MATNRAITRSRQRKPEGRGVAVDERLRVTDETEKTFTASTLAKAGSALREGEDLDMKNSLFCLGRLIQVTAAASAAGKILRIILRM